MRPKSSERNSIFENFINIFLRKPSKKLSFSSNFLQAKQQATKLFANLFMKWPTNWNDLIKHFFELVKIQSRSFTFYNQRYFSIITNSMVSLKYLESRDAKIIISYFTGRWNTLQCTGKLNLLKAQFCAFNTSDSTTIPLTVNIKGEFCPGFHDIAQFSCPGFHDKQQNSLPVHCNVNHCIFCWYTMNN